MRTADLMQTVRTAESLGAARMRTTKLIAAFVLPALVGCGTWRDRTPGDARGAWRTVRERYPDHKFTAEFETGFGDGYALSSSGGGTNPPVQYLTATGHGLASDYYRGFKYGSEVAVANATGRHAPANPVAVPYVPSAPARVANSGTPSAPQKGSDAPPRNKFEDPLEARVVAAEPDPVRPKLPKPEVPVIPPFNPDLSKFSTVPVADRDRLPIPVPALPVLPEHPLPVPTPDLPVAPALPLPASAPLAPVVPTPVPFIPFKH